MFKLVYFGKRRPKKVKTVSRIDYDNALKEFPNHTIVVLEGKNLEYSFEPFRAIEVDEALAKILLNNAGDIFKRIDNEPGKPDPKPIIKTDGYVGETPADKIPDLKKKIEQENKAEEGKSVEELIAEHSGKKKKSSKEEE